MKVGLDEMVERRLFNVVIWCHVYNNDIGFV